MKPIIFFCFVLWLTSCDTPTIRPEEAEDYVDTKVTVCGEIKGTFTSNKGNIFLNFGAEYPNQIFSVVIYSRDAATFDNNPATLYYGKIICATGVVKNYRGKPEIEVSDKNQIQIK
jgi:DNA/RNA endonuclease YhcR with UshA esterase domain